MSRKAAKECGLLSVITWMMGVFALTDIGLTSDKHLENVVVQLVPSFTPPPPSLVMPISIASRYQQIVVLD